MPVDVKKALKARQRGQSYKEIGEAQGVSAQAVHKVISPLLKDLPSVEELAEIKRTTADHFALTAYRAIQAITDDKLMSANAKDLTLIAGIATDKNRLMSGQSTSNQHVLLMALEQAEE